MSSVEKKTIDPVVITPGSKIGQEICRIFGESIVNVGIFFNLDEAVKVQITRYADKHEVEKILELCGNGWRELV
jgi:hypothetical protein